MEHEKGLDLSLALPCGGSNYSLKDKYESSSCSRSDEVDRGSKLINDFKNFLEGGNNQLPLKSEENFYNLGKSVVDLETSQNLNAGETWMANNSRTTVVEEEMRSGVREKRKNLFGEPSFQKKHEREANHWDLADKTRASHFSLNTDDGSTAENEDVAESDVDGSTSRQILQHDDVSKSFVVCAASSGKEFNKSSLSTPYGVSLPTHHGNAANMPNSQPLKDSKPAGTPSLSSYPLHGMMHPLAAANSERSGAQPLLPANFPMMVGYTHVQLPDGDNENNNQGLASHHQKPSHPRTNLVNSDLQNDNRKLNQVINHKSFEYIQYDGRAPDHSKSNGKLLVAEQGSVSHAGGNLRGSNTVIQAKDTSDQPKSESFLSGFPAIRTGMAADLKFGGGGNCPNLPWVSITGPGPNGRTISGVNYRYSPTHVRIVCACHGSHMSPEEFIQHASDENCGQDSESGLKSLPSSNPANSAQN